MSNRYVASRNVPASASGGVNLVRLSIGALLLAVGTLFAHISFILRGLGRRCANDTTLDMVARAVKLFRSGPQRSKYTPWELRLQATGMSLVISIFGALTILWILLLGGGALVWLVLHGWGPFVLLGTVVIGAIIGYKRAQLIRQMPSDELVN